MSARSNLAELAKFSTPDELKAHVQESLGDLEFFEVLSSQILVAMYVEPERTKGGIIRIDRAIDESRYQGKAALLLKKGPTAFKYDGAYNWEGRIPEVGEWIFHRTSDAWDIDLKGIPCRLIDSDLVKGVIDDPALIY